MAACMWGASGRSGHYPDHRMAIPSQQEDEPAIGAPPDASVTVEAETVRVDAEEKRQYSAHLNPVHVSNAPSLLSRRVRTSFSMSTSEARNQRREREGRNTSRPLDITGFKHLLLLVLLIGNVKMILIDWSQFGFLDTLKSFGFGGHDLEMAAAVIGFNTLFLPCALAVQKVAAALERAGQYRPLARALVALVQLVLCVGAVGGGSYLTWVLVEHPLVATGCELNVIVTFLKLTSFVLTNQELHAAWASKAPIPAYYAAGPIYPANLTLGNSLVYWVAPTLVYQPVYPRRDRIRWSRIPTLVFEILIGNMLIWVLMMQMGQPVLEHLVAHIPDWRVCMEDMLTLVFINIFIWLTGFVVLFHSMLNLVGELSRFSDRKFYSDWWNAGSVGTFWRDWNLPVSNYFRRHIYVPLRTRGVSRMLASNAVFFVSALLHELLFGVGTHNFNGVAFLCMMVQPILILATEPLERMHGPRSTVDNCMFWLAIMLGQPTAIVIYFLQWVSRHPQSKNIVSRWWFHMF